MGLQWSGAPGDLDGVRIANQIQCRIFAGLMMAAGIPALAEKYKKGELAQVVQ